MFGGANTSFVAKVSWVSAWYMRSLVYLPFGWCLSSNFLPFSSWPVTQAGWLSFWERSSGWHYHAEPFSEVFGTYTNLILCLPVSVLVSDYCRGLSRIRTEVQSTTWGVGSGRLEDRVGWTYVLVLEYCSWYTANGPMHSIYQFLTLFRLVVI